MSHPINPRFLGAGKKIADEMMEAAFGRPAPASPSRAEAKIAPSEELRKAAQYIRDVAGKATPGPWINVDSGDRIIRDPDATAREDDSDPCGEGPPLEYVVDEPLFANPANGDQIALFDPIAALLVAAELDQRAAPLETVDANAQRFLLGDREGATLDPALALARAVNAKAEETAA